MKQSTLNVVIAALGGEGGGVLADWIAATARSEGWQVQSTSVPGVAQRTGATIYYIEMFPKSEKTPVMSLFPTQGDVDLVIASEIVEAGRMVQRGLVTPDRTELLASDHRVYGIGEKIQLADGIVDGNVLREVCAGQAKRFIHFDLLQLAREHNTVISATLFGAVAGANLLPFEEAAYEGVIRSSGIQVEKNLAAFRASRNRAASMASEPPAQGDSHTTREIHPSKEADVVESSDFVLPEGKTAKGVELLRRVSHFPNSVQPILLHGIQRLVDYQNADYALDYIACLEGFLERMKNSTPTSPDDSYEELLRELGRYLALWLSFEDIARVAQLKTRPRRLDEIKDEVGAAADQFVYVTEYFSPRVEEFCAYLPSRLARYILHSPGLVRFAQLFTGGRRIRSNTISFYLVLRAVAALRHLRLKTYGYTQERRHIDAWLDAIQQRLDRSDLQAAVELARCGRLIKGYGETRERGQRQLAVIIEQTEKDADTIRHLREAAFSDDEGVAFSRALAAN